MEAARLPRNSPGPILSAVFGVLLYLRTQDSSIQAPAPALAGCILAAIVVTGDIGVININDWLWTLVILIVGIPWVYWRKVEKFWKND
jgi:hypothetical protein